MAGAPGGAGYPPLHRTGVFLQRIQDSADPAPWRVPLVARRLETVTNRVDFLARDRDAGSFRGDVWKMAGRGGAEEGDVCLGDCFALGFYVSYLGVTAHQLWLIYLGYGVIGGTGLGLGYISPVSTLIKWFPDRPGLATGMAIMGFGGGAMIGSPLGIKLMAYFHTPADVGVGKAFLVMGTVYFLLMMFGVFTIRVPREGWMPESWTPTPSRRR